jgi:hypothetical protein
LAGAFACAALTGNGRSGISARIVARAVLNVEFVSRGNTGLLLRHWTNCQPRESWSDPGLPLESAGKFVMVPHFDFGGRIWLAVVAF